MVMKRLLGGYLLMVGVPLVFIVVVMNAGRDIVAPPSIGGDWVMEWEQPAAAAKGERRLPEAVGGSLGISQSGRHLTAQWNQDRASAMKGTLDQGQFTLCPVGTSSESCSSDPLHLNGRILEENGERRLEVRLDPLSDDGQELVLLSPWRKVELRPSGPGYNH